MVEIRHSLPKTLRSPHSSQRFSIDCGLVLSKLIYVDAASKEDIQYQHFATEDLRENLLNLTTVLSVADDVSITGDNGSYAECVVKSLFRVSVTRVEEVEALSTGLRVLVENVDESDIVCDNVTNIEEQDVFTMDENNPLIKMVRSGINSRFANVTISNDEKIRRPCILIWAGATVKFYLLKTDGSTDLIEKSQFGGETFRGLAKVLVDSNNYDKITDYAMRGRRANVDTQVKEIFSEDPNSPYGKLPLEMPLFSFGKCADRGLGKEDLSAEDIMASLANLLFSHNMMLGAQMCQVRQVDSMYIGGGLFHAAVFDRFLRIREKMMFSKVKAHRLDCNYVLALGALFSD